ncbi:VTT domain-containing protein [Hafnia alvei]|uniref:DedA family protein n=1 Tax=Hafnia alvei TaxID=569 RepID=UPI001F41632B|nr:VTT domain-containing protein [Hafnia alvei]MCE9872297.1 VTT domain-containing protein [Hafnia alvei]
MAWLETFLSQIADRPVLIFALLFAIALGKSTVMISSILPPASLMLLAVIAISQPSLSITLVWLAITLGATLGSVLTFHFGQLINQRMLFPRFFSRHNSKLQRISEKLQHKSGLLVLFTSRFVAVLRYMVPMAAGMMTFSRTRVYCVTAFSAAVWACLFIGIVSGALHFAAPII